MKGKEIWKPIPRYEGIYEISNMGNVKSLSRERVVGVWGGKTPVLKERILKLGADSSGYPTVKLYGNGMKRTPKVHRLVADAFIPNPHQKKEINHINGIKSDNRVENLEWCTRTENIRHADATGLRNCTGENNHTAKLRKEQVLQIKERLSDGANQTKLGIEYNVSASVINHIKTGRTWKSV